MAADDSSGPRSSPVVLRIKLRYDDIDSMVQRFAANVGRSGLFLPTKSIQPLDSEVKFELRLANDTPAVVGLGRVRATRAADPANPRLASGMTVELMRVTRDSRDVIMRMLERRRELGLPDVAMPMPADVDAARRADSEPAAKAVPEAAPVELISGPVLGPVLGSGSASGPVSTESLLTAPRPMTSARDHGIKPLAPEPMKRPRVRISELIAKSAGVVAATPDPDADSDVDVASALARARALAGGDLDKELESLTHKDSAAPSEISIEAASAELAKQLGGNAVRRDRGARLPAPPAGPVAEGTSERLTVAAAAAREAEVSRPPIEALATPVETPIEAPPTEALTQPPTPQIEEVAAPPVAAPLRIEVIAPPAKGLTQPLPRIRPLAPLSSIAPLPAVPRFLVDQKFDSRPEPAAEPAEVAEWDNAGPTVASTEPPGGLSDVGAQPRTRPEPTRPQPGRPEPVRPEPVRPREPSKRPETPNPTYLRASTADIAEAVAAIDSVADSLVTGSETIAEHEDHADHELQAREPIVGLRSSSSSSSMDAAIDDAIDAAMLHTPAPDDGPDDGPDRGPADGLDDVPDIGSDSAVHQLSELDMEDVENTNVGGAPELDGGYGHDLAEQLERHLADAEAEAEAELHTALGESSATEQPSTDGLDEFEIEEVSDFEIIAEADAEDADLLLADGERDASQDTADPYAEPHPDPYVTPDPDAFGEPPFRPSQDFASRLDFGDDEFSEDNHPRHAGLPETPPVTVTPSAGYKLSAYDDRIPEDRPHDEDEPLDFDRPSERYRYPNRPFNFADRLRSDIDEPITDRPPHEEFDEPHAGFGQPRYESSPAEAAEPSRDVELERTLSALDVDLDDLSLPHARPLTPSPPSGPLATARTRTPSGPVEPVRTKQPTPQAQRTKQPTPQAQPVPEIAPVAGSGRIHRRASTEDGIMIDFDDDAED